MLFKLNHTVDKRLKFRIKMKPQYIYSEKQQQLFHVLVAYSMYNTEVGYCQGMSQIAALLLMFMGEEVGVVCRLFLFTN